MISRCVGASRPTKRQVRARCAKYPFGAIEAPAERVSKTTWPQGAPAVTEPETDPSTEPPSPRVPGPADVGGYSVAGCADTSPEGSGRSPGLPMNRSPPPSPGVRSIANGTFTRGTFNWRLNGRGGRWSSALLRKQSLDLSLSFQLPMPRQCCHFPSAEGQHHDKAGRPEYDRYDDRKCSADQRYR